MRSYNPPRVRPGVTVIGDGGSTIVRVPSYIYYPPDYWMGYIYEPCPVCDATGREPVDCPKCHGTGQISCPKTEKCKYCNGRGETELICQGCNGARTVFCEKCLGNGYVGNPQKMPDNF